MIEVLINGEKSSISAEGLPKFSDLVELIKSTIDPSHIITNITLNGKELEEAVWFSSPHSLGTCILEVSTNTPEDFIGDRLEYAGSVVQSCFLQFRDARKTFQEGKWQTGNRKLSVAVNTLHSFLQWHNSIIALIPEVERKEYEILPQTHRLLEICQKLIQQQMYQSWWALGETIEKQLEPELDKLEDACRKHATRYAGVKFAASR